MRSGRQFSTTNQDSIRSVNHFVVNQSHAACTVVNNFQLLYIITYIECCMGVFSITLGALMCCEYGILQFIESTKEQSEQSDNKANKAATKRKKWQQSEQRKTSVAGTKRSAITKGRHLVGVTEVYRAQTNTTKRTKQTKENLCRGNKEVIDNKGKTPGRSHWGVSGSEHKGKPISDNKGKHPVMATEAYRA